MVCAQKWEKTGDSALKSGPVQFFDSFTENWDQDQSAN